MNVDIIVAFVAGVVIPLLIALVGKEPIGKWMYAKQEREQTALNALIGLAQESIAGWRESNAAVMELSRGLDAYKGEADKSRSSIYISLTRQGEMLTRLDARVASLVTILAEKE